MAKRRPALDKHASVIAGNPSGSMMPPLRSCSSGAQRGRAARPAATSCDAGRGMGRALRNTLTMWRSSNCPGRAHEYPHDRNPRFGPCRYRDPCDLGLLKAASPRAYDGAGQALARSSDRSRSIACAHDPRLHGEVVQVADYDQRQDDADPWSSARPVARVRG
jgi:hypothetical protein